MKKIVLFTGVSVTFLGMVACSSQKTDNTKDIYLRFLGGDMSVLEESQRENLFIREHLDFEDDTRKCPEYTIDDEEVDKDAFEKELKSKILDHALERSSWKVIEIE
ncbi:hypothetical protein SAMN04487770_102257 [Butyrivibrio sp. ob235]|uniref:hypothetical protein n=1 Tax=Butyrivibrio sp. ob235 TaxID=1761780 RepID=UPI0008ADF485|nr:hypothetical protein [Butyrivibrio sp. ob235]SEK68871.1 hypothetical protein SAMN04487770_102257 [Butyrivibrio sp. ob235]